VDHPKTFVAYVQKGFRIVIPPALRKVLMIKEGDYIEVTIKKLESEGKKEGI